MSSLRARQWVEPLVVVALFLFAFALRVYRLEEFPPGLTFDEAANGLDALDILRGAPSLFFLRHDGREPLFIYLQAASVWLLGPTPFALRVTSAVVGALTVPAAYWMVREAFWKVSARPRAMAFWSALFLATAYWHLNFSRIGYRAIMVPLMACLTFALFWRAWRHLAEETRLPWGELLACGVTLGLSLYTYLAARFLPVLVVAVVVFDLATNRSDPAGRKRRLYALAVISAAALVVFSPLAVFFIVHPGTFFARAADASLSGAGLAWAGVAQGLVDSVRGTAGMLTVAGDANFRHNPAGRPALDVFISVWFLAGFVLCLRRWRSLPYSFLLLWLLVFSLPAILAATEIPHFLRSIGMIPAVFAVPVVALLAAAEVGGHRWRQWARWLPLPFLLFSAAVGISAYFSAMEAGPAPAMAFQQNFRSLGEYMKAHSSPEAAWLLPIAGPRAWTRPSEDNFTVQYLAGTDSGWGTVVVDPDQAPDRLPQLLGGRQRANIVTGWGQDVAPETPYLYADVKNLLPFVLAKHGRYLGETGTGDFRFRTYDLPVASDYGVVTAYQPVQADFDGKLRLTGLAFGRTALDVADVNASLEERSVPSGGTAWVALRWQAQTPITIDLKTTLFLTDDAGHLAGQVDDLLVGDAYPFTRTWEAGETAYTYHILSTLPGVPSGEYELNLGVYEAVSGRRYGVVAGGDAVSLATTLGKLAVTAAVAKTEVSPGHMSTSNSAGFSGLGLVGYDLVGETFSPGDGIPLTLYWQAMAGSLPDYRVSLQIQGSDGSVDLVQSSQPMGGQYGTSNWREGELVRDWQDLAIPVTLPTGDYTLAAIIEQGGRALGSVNLGPLVVRGRPREFVTPAVQYPDAVSLGADMRLVGHAISAPEVRAGQSVSVTLFWRAERSMSTSYTVFVHLLDSSGKVRAQLDSIPGLGSLATTGWSAGEYLRDAYSIPIPVGVPEGDYRIEIGAYDAPTGLRLAVRNNDGTASGDQIMLPQTVRVIVQ